LSAHLVYRIYAYLPTATNKQLNEYIREFEEFNLRAVELAKAVRVSSENLYIRLSYETDIKATEEPSLPISACFRRC
jgi:hypothetical protein